MKKLIVILLLLSSPGMAQQLIITEKVKFLALGDSYTIGESVPVRERWPEQLIDALQLKGLECFDPKIIATTGWRTDNLKNAITAAKLSPDYNLVSLLIGVNNYYQGKSVESYAPEFEELLNTAIALAGGNKKHVFVVSIPDYGYTPFGKGQQAVISQGIDVYNATNKTIAAKLGVKYYNITDISRRGLDEPDLVANDGLHPSGKMYAAWVKLILQEVTLEPSTDEGDNGGDGTVTGIKDERYGVRIYPNPFDKSLVIENLPETQRSYSLELVDEQGSVVWQEEALASLAGKIELNTHALRAGLYHYRLKGSEGLLMQGKIIRL
ncbi:GDSL-type esterase/lipase family protein [Chryseolinea lacunae]|uniref:T9SS type A sorting domain-containing protein n=1 Tax=Chryseolinea lacunae TaxID=2801331 RepID=A0ABS1KVZ1_9BACT|nr:GDSL-type esterase/lipase family protein [Chryseolinea lacunae]MBL0743639.1 T9SS type A sorting domain-containing protein [Chryseolinea lacunae]